MNLFKGTILPILLTTIWISVSEFVRNEFLLKSYWTAHYQNPAKPSSFTIPSIFHFLHPLPL